MGYIIQLDELLANKIAAGEVVERPASVVKELTENAVDAGANIIEIDLEEAGLASIKITDNGSGILEDDLLTAFSRHATSKIKNEHDLFRIKTLGFRGEALPSIASVSKVMITTSTGDAGSRAEFHGGKCISRTAAPARKGTDIEVTDLFYNTPARLKYMKTVNTELGNVTDIVNRIALSHPEISFRLRHNGKTLLHTNGQGDVRQVLAAIYGFQTVKKMLPFKGESLDFTITGYAGLPEVTRASRNYLSVLVNGRYIKNYAITRAITEGYHTLLPIGRFPVVLLSIEMDPILVDVNVHPSKQEVRFSKEKELTSLISETIKALFHKETLIPSGVKESRAVQKPSEQISFNWDESFKKPFSESAKPKEDEDVFLPKQVMEKQADFREDAEQLIDKTTTQHHIQHHEEQVDEYDDEPVQARRMPDLSVIGQAHGTYIICQGSDGIYLIDQHAAQERIKYEYYRDKLAAPARETQDLLVPLTLDYSTDDFIRISENRRLLEQVGVFLEDFGTSGFIVRSYPVWFPKGEEKETVEEMIEQMLTMKKINIGKLREEAAIMMSCKKSIKANHYLQKSDMDHLVNELGGCYDPFTCPHGRPVIIQFSIYEMEKMFKRVM
ncbi:DNA mismatch repair endonuclease MutL [Jeotgalibacillus aurantiacus]|uniref:DNA mismatch repair endonuclease MutL n=1 Tax=Jeotgalibacillus aurantiacus TaxID=2763266 RepID=UPI001D0A782A|nr:DNA mismatch repair endonuclease MutL [Jeotgalibacillus aurantiacus]